MHIALSMFTVERSLSVAIALQPRNGRFSVRCRLEQMAAQVAICSRSRQAMLGTLLDATLPTARRGRPAFRAVWVNEAMNRAYNMIRLTALLDKFAPPCCLDVTAGEAERRDRQRGRSRFAVDGCRRGRQRSDSVLRGTDDGRPRFE